MTRAGSGSEHLWTRHVARLLALVLGVSGLAAVIAAPPAPAADKVTLTIGTKQDVDNMNPYSGVVLSAYEVWNMQYDYLTNLSADDMSPVPDLATSWERSDDGLTWTYHLRPDVKWSDGTPFTADDVVYTFTRTRDEEWSNFSIFTEGFTKVTAPDKNTVVITTSEPDPKLPNIPAYILPKHIFEKYGPKKIASFDNRNPVTTGPFRLTEWNKGTSFTMTANKNYFGGAPKVDTVRFRIFRNDESMAAALRNGEIDVTYDLAPQLVPSIKGNKNITVSNAKDGSFNQLTMNTGSGPIGNGHPALADVRVRQAIAHAVDKPTLVRSVLKGLGSPGQSMNVAVNPKWNLTVPADKEMDFDIAQANKILDDAGYKKGSDGIREMPDGSKQLNFRLYYPPTTPQYAKDVEFIKGWLKQIGIGTTVSVKSEDEMTPIENGGKFDLIVWNWVPYTDPSAMMSYLTCGQVPAKADDGRYNDAFYCDPEYDRLYEAQKTELDEAKRIDLVKQAQQRFYDQAPYVVLYTPDTVDAYRNDKFDGFVRQPAGDGPIIYSQSDPSYPLIKPISADVTGSSSATTGSSSSDSSSSTGLIIAIIAAIVIIAIGAYFLTRRRRTADERE